MSKGCPAKCTFCFNSQFHRSTHRTRPPEKVIDEIEYLINNCGMDGVSFCDELWHPQKEDREKMYSLIKERQLDFVWGFQTRLGIFERDDFQQMYDAGCRWILFGVETGCQERSNETKKGINLDKVRETFDICREIGITTQSAFIIGYPDETEKELKETIDFALELNANLCPLSILCYLPGSELFDEVVGNKRYDPPITLEEWRRITVGDDLPVNLTKVPDLDLFVIHYYFQWLGFSKKDSISSDSYGIVKKMASDAAKKLFQHGFISFLPGAYASLKQFFVVLWYAKAHPKTLKKYGLYTSKQRKKPY